MGRPGARRHARRDRRAPRPPRAGQPHRRAPEVRRPARLFLPDGDGRIIFAIPYPGRLHPDRHHGPRLRRRPVEGRGDRGRGRLPLRRGERVFRRAGPAGGRGVVLLRGAAALRRRRLARRRRRRGTTCCGRGRGRRPAAAQRLRRQAHDLPAPRRGGDGAGGGPARRRGRAGRRGDAAGRRLPGRASTRLSRISRRRIPGWTRADARGGFRLYGTCAAEVVGDAKRPEDLGRDFGAGLREAEVGYLVRREWAQTAEDVLWRRTKLGLRLSPEAARRSTITSRPCSARSRRSRGCSSSGHVSKVVDGETHIATCR
jgi:hypothetical protein